MTGVKMNSEVVSMSQDTQVTDANGAPYTAGADSTCPATGNGTPVTTLLELAKARLTDPTLANTLIVVTADHDHTMVMNGYAAEG